MGTSIGIPATPVSGGYICTITDIQLRKGLDSSTDSIITAIVAGVTAEFETFCRRQFIVNNYTEYYTGIAGDLLLVNSWPIVSITSVKEALGYDFDSAEGLVADMDYRLLNGGLSGLIKRLNCNWLSFDDSIQVVYRGGYTAAGETPATGELAIPADLRELAIIECCNRYDQRNSYGTASIDYDNGSVTRKDNRPFLEQVVVGLEKYKRPEI